MATIEACQPVKRKEKVIRHQFLVFVASNLLERNFRNFPFDNRIVIKPKTLFIQTQKGEGTPTQNNWLRTEENFNVKCLMFLITKRSTQRHERKYSKITKYLRLSTITSSSNDAIKRREAKVTTFCFNESNPHRYDVFGLPHVLAKSLIRVAATRECQKIIKFLASRSTKQKY